MWKTTKNKFHSLNQFVVLSFSITLTIVSLYFFKIGLQTSLFGNLYLLSIPSYYYIIALALSLLTFPLYFLPYINYIAIIPKSILDTFLIINFFVFKVYRFHIDAFFINMAINDSKGTGLSTLAIVISIFIAVTVFSLNSWFFYKAKNTQLKNLKKIIIFLFALILFNQITHIWGAYFQQQTITRLTPYFPYFLPTTSTSRMEKLTKSYPFIIPPNSLSSNDSKITTNSNNSLFNYPKASIHFNNLTKEKYPNILFFVLESWRSDMLKKEITPNIQFFANKNTQYSKHYSGGNVTISGLFSLLYGIHPTNMKSAQADPYKYQSIFTKSLTNLGYSIDIFTSSNLNRFSMKPMFFGDINNNHYHLELDKSVATNDKKVTDKLIKSLQNETTKQPWFKFIFLTSSHHSYHYPDKYKKFSPTPNNAEGFLFNQQTDAAPYLNDYKNSLLYVDSLFAQINLQLKKMEDNTIIIVTSDHGEEFNDNKAGYWGHGSNFTKYQASVPLVIHTPKQSIPQIINKRSSHIDIVPTLLIHLGITNKTTDYSSGYNLLSLPQERSLIMTSYKDKAYLIDNTIFSSGVFTDSYQLNDFTHKNDDYDFQAINDIKRSELHFLSP